MADEPDENPYLSDVLMTEQPYGGEAPSVSGSDTSEAAAQSLADLPGLQAEVYRCICESAGRTCDEIEVLLGLRHQTASARIRELVLKRLVRDSGRRRLTRSRRQAVVWVRRHLDSGLGAAEALWAQLQEAFS